MRKPTRAQASFWLAMQRLFGTSAWGTTHGLEPTTPWRKLIDRFTKQQHTRAIALMAEERAAGKIPGVPAIADVERYLEGAVTKSQHDALVVRRNIWRGNIYAEFNTAAQVLGLLKPAGKVTELPPTVLVKIRAKAETLLLNAENQLNLKVSEIDVQNAIAREADTFMSQIKGLMSCR